MAWLHKLFGMEKSQNSEQSPNEPNQQSPNEPNSKNQSNKQGFSSVLQVIVEEVITATAYWLITLVKQGLESKKTSEVAPQSAPVQDPVGNRLVGLEELLPKVSSLIDQSYQRNEAMGALESRLGAMERLLEADRSSTQPVEQFTQVMTALESRISKVEN